jgi:predicted  nucleic acid-binding Zn-ribbon protein
MVVDTDGEYWGLKQEYEILHVGADEECDLQVGPEHAEKLAELALEQNVPIILDVSGYLEEDAASELVRETARHLFTKEKKLKKPFLLIVEEVHEYIPEGAGMDATGEMLVKIGKRGRKHGLGLTGISQRPADVKKDFITQCDWLIWHRLTWENDTQVVRRVVGDPYDDEVQDLADGEAFLLTDWDDEIRRVQWRRKHTFDAGATPGLDEFERPDLKSVSGDLVDELEEISDREERRQDRISQLERELDEREQRIAELEDELESSREMRDLAEQFAEGLQASGGATEVTQEKVSDLVDEKNELERELEAVREEREELQQRVADLQSELEKRPALDDVETAREATERLAEAFGVTGDGEAQRLREKLQRARDRIDELESDAAPAEPEMLENPKVERFLQNMERAVEDLDDKQFRMLQYYRIYGPDSPGEAYKYAGGSPTSGSRHEKNRGLRDAGFVSKVDQGSYDYALREHVEDVLAEHFDGEVVDAVVQEVEQSLDAAIDEA